MDVVIIILVVGAFIQSFIHCTRGTIHAFDKLFGYNINYIFNNQIWNTMFIHYAISILWQ